MTTVNKALVPAIAMLFLAGLGFFGITEAMTVGEAVTMLVTSGLVWLVPNKQLIKR
jgi:hypothetical protein